MLTFRDLVKCMILEEVYTFLRTGESINNTHINEVDKSTYEIYTVVHDPDPQIGHKVATVTIKIEGE